MPFVADRSTIAGLPFATRPRTAPSKAGLPGPPQVDGPPPVRGQPCSRRERDREMTTARKQPVHGDQRLRRRASTTAPVTTFHAVRARAKVKSRLPLAPCGQPPEFTIHADSPWALPNIRFWPGSSSSLANLLTWQFHDAERNPFRVALSLDAGHEFALSASAAALGWLLRKIGGSCRFGANPSVTMVSSKQRKGGS